MLPLGWAVQFPVIDWGYSCISTNVVAIFGQKGQLKLAPKTHAWKTTGILPLKKHISPGRYKKYVTQTKSREIILNKCPIFKGDINKTLWEKIFPKFSSFSLKLNSLTPRNSKGWRAISRQFWGYLLQSWKTKTLCPWKPISRIWWF